MDSIEDISLNEKVEVAIHEAVKHLRDIIEVESLESDSHNAIIIKGWNIDHESQRAIAKYFIGLRAAALDVALRVSAYLIDDTPIGKLNLISSIDEIVGRDSSSLSDIQIRDERNPWLAESLWHLCMFLANDIKDCHPCGDVKAIGPVHVKAKDHGLDGIVLYEKDNKLGLTLIETKAYKDAPNRAIGKAVEFFTAIDNGTHDTRIRQDVSNLRYGLPLEIQKKISGTFWDKNRSYIANPHYDSATSVDWKRNRTPLTRLAVGKENIIIMPNIIEGFEGFFDGVANEMRSIVRGF